MYLKPLPSHLQSKYPEWVALYVLRYCWPDEYSELFISDRPDLQSKRGIIGIEVTEAISERQAKIRSNFTNFIHHKNYPDIRELSKSIIENNGGTVDDISVLYPQKTAEDEQAVFLDAIQKKVRKLPSYQDRCFKKMGLFIWYDEPLVPTMDDYAELFERALNIQETTYDCLWLCHSFAILSFDNKTKKLGTRIIPREDFDTIKYNARIALEEQR